jgi:hypothetical protein
VGYIAANDKGLRVRRKREVASHEVLEDSDVWLGHRSGGAVCGNG